MPVLMLNVCFQPQSDPSGCPFASRFPGRTVQWIRLRSAESPGLVFEETSEWGLGRCASVGRPLRYVARHGVMGVPAAAGQGGQDSLDKVAAETLSGQVRKAGRLVPGA